MLATLLVSRGVPMLLGGDELGRTQGGNNNAYCQDNETSWLDWSDVDAERLAFTSRLLALRARAPRAARRGDASRHATARLEWFAPDGAAMTTVQWEMPTDRCVAIRATSAVAAPTLTTSS